MRRGDLRVVLRRPPRPPLPPSAHDVLREARLLRALAPSRVPVPAVLAECDDEGVLGVPFCVMAEVAGTVVTGREPRALAVPRSAAARAKRSSTRSPTCMPSTAPQPASTGSGAPTAISSDSCGASPGCGR